MTREKGERVANLIKKIEVVEDLGEDIFTLIRANDNELYLSKDFIKQLEKLFIEHVKELDSELESL